MPASEAEQPFRTTISRLNLLCANLIVEPARLPGWSRMEIRWPWSPSSEAVSAVFSLPPQRITALPASFGLGLLLANVRFAVPEAVLPSICVSAKLPGQSGLRRPAIRPAACHLRLGRNGWRKPGRQIRTMAVRSFSIGHPEPRVVLS